MTMVGASTTGAVLFAACGIPDQEFVVQSPANLPEDLVKGRANWFATSCGVCDGGEGVIVRVVEGRAKKIAGNPDFPVNVGKQSVRCDSALQMLYHPDRVTQPMVRHAKGSALTAVSWDEAETMLRGWAEGSAGRLTLATDPVRGYTGRVANEFARSFGGRHIAFDPLEQGVLHGSIRTVFGQERLPEFEIEKTRTLLSFGADFLGTWVSPTRYSVKYGEFRQGRADRGKLIHVEPRMSITAAAADEWVPIIPGKEGELAMAIANVLINERLVPEEGIRAYTANLPEGAVDVFDPEAVAGRSGEAITAERIRRIARDLAENGPSLVIGGGSAGAHTNGSFNLNAAYGLNILLGSVGAAGGLRYNPDSPIDGLPSSATGAPFGQWEEELAEWRAGNVDTLILRRANLVYGLPRSADAPDALLNVPHVAIFSDVMDETAQYADMVLPEASFLEGWGLDVPEPAPGYQAVGIQQPVVSPARTRDGLRVLSDARSFGDVLISVSGGKVDAGSMRSLVEEGVTSLYDQGRSTSSIKAPSADLFMRGTLQRGGWWDTKSAAESRPDDPPSLVDGFADAEFSDAAEGEAEVFHLMPFASQALVDGRIAAAPWAQATPDPITSASWTTWVEINNRTADRLGIREGDRLVIKSASGEIEALAYPHRAAPPDVLGVPIGQGHDGFGRYAEDRGANVLSILADKKDTSTGALAWAATRVKLFKTGERQKVPKFEGTVEAVAVNTGFPILVVRPGESAEDAIHEMETNRRFLGEE